jgi:hypothetical protein
MLAPAPISSASARSKEPVKAAKIGICIRRGLINFKVDYSIAYESGRTGVACPQSSIGLAADFCLFLSGAIFFSQLSHKHSESRDHCHFHHWAPLLGLPWVCGLANPYEPRRR